MDVIKSLRCNPDSVSRFMKLNTDVNVVHPYVWRDTPDFALYAASYCAGQKQEGSSVNWLQRLLIECPSFDFKRVIRDKSLTGSNDPALTRFLKPAWKLEEGHGAVFNFITVTNTSPYQLTELQVVARVLRSDGKPDAGFSVSHPALSAGESKTWESVFKEPGFFGVNINQVTLTVKCAENEQWFETQQDIDFEKKEYQQGLAKQKTDRFATCEELNVKPVSFVGTKAGQEWDGNGLGMKFCWCPPGSFLMGSPPDEPDRSDDEDQVQVTLTQGFWLGKYEVTQREWVRVMGYNPSLFSPGSDGKAVVASPDTSSFPVENVTWNEAVKFCQRLTEAERHAGKLLSGWEYRLPTEAQWEYACRAGTRTATAFGGRLSSTQADFDGKYPYNGVVEGQYLERTAAVGSYGGNHWGLHDMHGNVWEWCQDWYAEKLPGGRDPRVTPKASYRVTRGGSWRSLGRSCRSAFRGGDAPAFRDDSLGFRVASVPVE